VAQPWTHAARTNRLKVLTGYATRGEFEPISFAVVPLRDLGAMTCTCTDLTGPGGAKVPASAVKVGYVKYWDMVDKRARPKAVRPQPHLLMDRNVIAETESRVTRQWWLTVHAGPAAAGGTYEGTVTVSAAKGGKAEVPVRFDVIGLTLDPPGASMLLNYSLPWSQLFYGDDDARWRQIERELRLQRDHGMTSVAVSGLHLPVKDEDTAQWERFLDLYKEVGFPRPVYMAGTMNLYNQFKNLLDPKQQQAYCDVFRRLDAAAKKKGQKAIYSVGDELTNDGREALTALVSKITHDRIPEIETISDINGYRELMLSAPYLNAAGFNNGWHGGYKTNRRGHDLIVRTVIERVKAAGCTPWFINGSKGRYPFGVFFWKMQSVGLAGKCEWHFHAHTSDPYNPFDSNQFNAFGSLVFPVCIPTVLMEQCREGIDDLRYVRTLQRVVAEKAKAAQGDPVLAGRVAAAREALDYWTDQVPDRLYTAHTPDGSGEHTGKDFPEARLRQFRDDVAGHLCRLLELRSERLYPAEVVLASFENGSRDGWTRKVGLADRHATHGKTSAELAFTDKQTYFDAWGRMNVKDWRGCRALRLDAFNPQDRPVTLVLTIRDQLASAVNAEASARKTVAFDLKPGANSLTVPLVGIQDDSGKRPLDLSCVFNLFFTVRGAKGDVTVYVDHLRLAQHD